MPDPEIPAAITDEPQAEAMAPVDDDERRKRTTHEVDAADMGTPSPL